MTTHIRLTKNTGWWLLIIGSATVLVIFWLSLSARQATLDPNDILRNKLAQAIEDNKSKLSCGVLVWRTEQKGFGPLSNKPEITGHHQLWWDNKRTAIKCTTHTANHDPNDRVSSSQKKYSMTYDGKRFRIADIPVGSTGKVELGIFKKPTSLFYRYNYLHSVGWQASGGLNDVSKATEPGVETWSTEQGNAIKYTFHSAKTGQVVIRTYDIEEAGGLVIAEIFSKENTLQLKTTVQYEQVSGGAWFPVSVIT
ncbi:MAG: hypothetical protein IIA65_08165, partial [Planctomycetes bacterium]|nr:hypothetical protein [Planctomycetota bacterium]